MKWAGMSWPVLASLRRPVSISWVISARTVVTPPSSWALILIVFAGVPWPLVPPSRVLAAAAADGHLHAPAGAVELAARPHHRHPGRGLAHLQARRGGRLGAGGEPEARGQRR